MKIPALCKTYNGKKVLDLPPFELNRGEITSIIGSNGSGKTTLARILAGIEKSDDKISLSESCRVGFMPQKSIAFRMSTEKNILLGGSDPSRAEELMRALSLNAIAKNPGKKLSGGETARMALARILMGHYDLLILDEPTASMDMESTLASERLIRTYCSDENCSILLVTHSLAQARRLSDEVLYLQKGKLVESGPAQKVLNDPGQEETKIFLDFYG